MCVMCTCVRCVCALTLARVGHILRSLLSQQPMLCPSRYRHCPEPPAETCVRCVGVSVCMCRCVGGSVCMCKCVGGSVCMCRCVSVHV